MKVLTVFGTRPEAIKMAPVVKALAASPALNPVICLTGQHRDMLAGILDFFGQPRIDRRGDYAGPQRDLVYVTGRRSSPGSANSARRRARLGPRTRRHHHGACRGTAFYAGCRIGHVEAGLRTGDPWRPWPEEMNRSLIDRLADRLFAPTESARANLINENLPEGKIVVTGNTVVDALLAVRAALESDGALQRSAAAGLDFLDPTKS